MEARGREESETVRSGSERKRALSCRSLEIAWVVQRMDGARDYAGTEKVICKKQETWGRWIGPLMAHDLMK